MARLTFGSVLYFLCDVQEKMLFCSFLVIGAEPAFCHAQDGILQICRNVLGIGALRCYRIRNALNKSGASRPELGAIIHRAVEGSLPPCDLSQSETPAWSAFGTGIGAAFVIIAGSAAALLGAAGV